jgi:hypothetical protein
MVWRCKLYGFFRVLLIDLHEALIALCDMAGDFSIVKRQNQALARLATWTSRSWMVPQKNVVAPHLGVNRLVSLGEEHIWGDARRDMENYPSSPSTHHSR